MYTQLASIVILSKLITKYKTKDTFRFSFLSFYFCFNTNEIQAKKSLSRTPARMQNKQRTIFDFGFSTVYVTCKLDGYYIIELYSYEILGKYYYEFPVVFRKKEI